MTAALSFGGKLSGEGAVTSTKGRGVTGVSSMADAFCTLASGGKTAFCAKGRTEKLSAIAMSIPWEGRAGEAQNLHLGLLIVETWSWRHKKG